MRFAPTKNQTSGIFFAPDGIRLEKLTGADFLFIDLRRLRAQQLKHSDMKIMGVIPKYLY